MTARLHYVLPALVSILVGCGFKAHAQENPTLTETVGETLVRVEQDIALLQSGQFVNDPPVVARRAWGRLKDILKSNPDDNVRARVAQDMVPLEEILGNLSLAIAEFYLDREHGGVPGARSRLEYIVKEFPQYSKTDRVLLRLAETYVREENAEPARTYLYKLVCRYPASDSSTKAFDRLNQIGFGAWDGCDKYK